MTAFLLITNTCSLNLQFIEYTVYDTLSLLHYMGTCKVAYSGGGGGGVVVAGGVIREPKLTEFEFYQEYELT